MLPESATAAGGRHPTGMHTFLEFFFPFCPFSFNLCEFCFLLFYFKPEK